MSSSYDAHYYYYIGLFFITCTNSLSSINERLIDGRGEVDGASCISSPAPSVTRTTIGIVSSAITSAKSLPCLNKANGELSPVPCHDKDATFH